MSNIYIYIITHKNIDNKIKLKNYGYLGVGYNENLNVEYRDNTLDNIANKNANYCELTAQYWISHNTDSKYVGLVHYRRFFYKNIFAYYFNKILDTNYFEKKLTKYDVILPKKWNMHQSIYNDYKTKHYIKDLDNCGKVIKDKYPEYYKSFENLKKIRKLSPCNMIITSKEIYDDYTKWLFDILFEVEKITDMSGYSKNNQRVFGFLSERLLNVYFDHHKEYKILYKPVYQIDDKHNTFFSRIITRLRHYKYELRCIIVLFLKKLGFKRKKKKQS